MILLGKFKYLTVVQDIWRRQRCQFTANQEDFSSRASLLKLRDDKIFNALSTGYIQRYDGNGVMAASKPVALWVWVRFPLTVLKNEVKDGN